ncbi:recombinase family protein [Allosphingosinicella deserti]|uniref:Recombinase family protein n=1 Tax=Allosphingosinicella deserti TaxID=2116704 RepID=A0A2P7QW47_9SPHN|nr:recombinase family protein [Sphingomonas deserti]PSJ42183.1 recombinase family protein [Sphingomonas deserti]
MTINWSDPESPDPPTKRAAQYLRMSTEHQRYSCDNQALAIAHYAQRHGYEIVRTYADEGKSGLILEGRRALQQLLCDVDEERVNFEALLVYDVSRLGRFQDPDEAASYELRCRKGGVAVHYCAEQFENDGSIASAILKTVKRAMAGEYSRELSVKVFAGKADLIRRGYRQGGPAGFGLRRCLVDQNGSRKQLLARCEQKSITTDRVVLVPGPPDEVAIVQEIYRLFAGGLNETELAALLNRRRIPTDLGRLWTRGSVHSLLVNDKYVGDNVWGRTSWKLKERCIRNARRDWICADAAFPAIVDKALHARVQAIIAARRVPPSDENMLDRLRMILASAGTLSRTIIDAVEDAPSSDAYQHRFGSLVRAYSLIGFIPAMNFDFLQIDRDLRQLQPAIIEGVVEGIERAGGAVRRHPKAAFLTVNDEFTAWIMVVRCRSTATGAPRWWVRLDDRRKVDLTVAVRMAEGNDVPHDYYLLPQLGGKRRLLRLGSSNGVHLDAFRCETLDPLFAMASRGGWGRAV